MPRHLQFIILFPSSVAFNCIILIPLLFHFWHHKNSGNYRRFKFNLQKLSNKYKKIPLKSFVSSHAATKIVKTWESNINLRQILKRGRKLNCYEMEREEIEFHRIVRVDFVSWEDFVVIENYFVHGRSNACQYQTGFNYFQAFIAHLKCTKRDCSSLEVL